MNKLLVICGPTAMGKTSLAVKLAKKFNGEIISSDSRQVYKGLDIGTGKDFPKGARIKYPWFSKYGYYEINGVKLWGYDLVDPKRDFSVAQYIKIAHKFIEDIAKQKKLPILVGGTGLYIRGVIDGIPTAMVPRNEKLRENLLGKTADELYEMLSQLDSIKAASLNSSDKKNPRRLARAIEVAIWMVDNSKRQVKSLQSPGYSTLFIGLTADKDISDKKIDERVDFRVRAEVKDEISKLLKAGVKWENQSLMSLGYRQYRDYFEGGVPEELVTDEWKKEEKRYAKRQMTWFKKDARVRWFDIADKNFPESVEKLAEKWYSSEYDEKSRNFP
jgi:tRNA dimethylallyltransferase